MDGESVDRAASLVRYFRGHLCRVYSAMDAAPRVADARKLLRWIGSKRLQRFVKRDAYQAAKGTFKTVEEMEPALAHCDRCGAVTMDRCQTCGHELPGAIVVPGLHPMGVRQPPRYCPTCGAAFPWTNQRRPPKREALVVLENLLRRLPRAIRELRVRHADRPPFRVVDEHDLEDLLRALLPLHFDDIRPESRTPSYAADTRTDFLLAPEGIALTLKFARPSLVEQLREDAAYYRREGKARVLVAFLHDPEATLREPHLLPAAVAEAGEELEVRCVVGAS